ncbi:MAG: fumarylacetoacetase [Blastocatellia bacterium]|nr:fumarylacetoacetase [Blastocatellia bacterium]
MNPYLNETHDPGLRSWVESANLAGTDFPIQNLPLAVFNSPFNEGLPRVGVAIGDSILDITEGWKSGFFEGPADRAAQSCFVPSLGPLMALGPEHAQALRIRLSQLLRVGGVSGQEQEFLSRHLVPRQGTPLRLPVEIGDYTDFYASVYHATNIGSMFRPDNPLLPNYKHIPIGYHGRASSIVVSGTTIHRPSGQTKDDAAENPMFGPCRLLDYELEVGFFVGQGNHLGHPVSIAEADNHIFGLCLVNDWSARDLQKWEYQPLGPFLAKSFSTTISPWVVTLDALAPFRIPAFDRPTGDPSPLPYLSSANDRSWGGIDLQLEVFLSSVRMREEACEPYRVSSGNFRDMYWTIAQMLTHHASNGCNLRPGDLLASGTVSGKTKDSRGCLMELTWRGTEPITLPTGEQRRFLQDGDEVMIRGFCERPGAVRIGFGECRGIIGKTED